jgi:hypothetical protein
VQNVIRQCRAERETGSRWGRRTGGRGGLLCGGGLGLSIWGLFYGGVPPRSLFGYFRESDPYSVASAATLAASRTRRSRWRSLFMAYTNAEILEAVYGDEADCMRQAQINRILKHHRDELVKLSDEDLFGTAYLDLLRKEFGDGTASK